ncbi:MAG TPA: PsbP-related protein, partial [Bacteroidota bacterium]
DPYFKVSFVYPKGWFVVNEPGKISIYNSQEASQKFFDPTSENPAGVRIVVTQEKDTLKSTLAQKMKDFKDDKMQSGFDIKSTTDRTIEGLPAMEVGYSGFYDKETKISGLRTVAWKDSSFYSLTYEGFNDMFEPYKVVYDSALASLTLPKPKVAAKNVDPSLPVEEFDKYANDVLEIAYPQNFSPSIEKTKGEETFAMKIKGYREDCFVTIDVRPAKKLALEKVVEQNSKAFKDAKGKTNTTISGEKAAYLNFTPVKNIDGRVYFMVKNDKFYRIITYYYSPMKKSFQPAFDKVIASIRFK